MPPRDVEEGSGLDVTLVKVADNTAGPSLSSGVRLKPGAKAVGWVVVEVPKGVTATTARSTRDSGMADQAGEWKLK
ncbi:hypothetical protein [Streptomyces sp. NPDC018059]|uniref:hypothetical protein n=1 Tax=Streptomyces sp. NPDC018059 TaxID=3365041 RepID=UPI0037A0120F